MGALLSGLIIPFITKNWQDRQKSLEIRTTLVSEISNAVMEFFMSIQFVHIRKETPRTSLTSVPSHEQAEFDQAYKAWEVKSAVIGTKLQAYFPKSDIPKTWTAFADVMTGFYALEGIVESQLPSNMTVLANQISATLFYDLPESATYMQLREALLKCKSHIIRAILQTKVSLS